MSAAAKYTAMARQSASRGSKNFVFVTSHDDAQSWPSQRVRNTDNPFKDNGFVQRFQWLMHDIRTLGLRETIRIVYYAGMAWYPKGEKIFVGEDDNGNTYWYSWDSQRVQGGRFMIPKDPHIFRGQDANTAPPNWHEWLYYQTAHTPATMKARGEFGMHGRLGNRGGPWHVKWHSELLNLGVGIDPTYVPTPNMLVSPWYKQMKEAGFSRWTTQLAIFQHAPMMPPHDLKPEVVEEFYRGQFAYCRWTRGHDHDEWKG